MVPEHYGHHMLHGYIRAESAAVLRDLHTQAAHAARLAASNGPQTKTRSAMGQTGKAPSNPLN